MTHCIQTYHLKPHSNLNFFNHCKSKHNLNVNKAERLFHLHEDVKRWGKVVIEIVQIEESVHPEIRNELTEDMQKKKPKIIKKV